MRKEILRIKNLNFSFNQDEILSNVSFSVYSGEMLSIIGTNGMGKTILGKILSGNLQADSGMVLYQGKQNYDKKSCAMIQKEIGYIPEEGKILENLTVAENVFIGMEKSATFYFNKNIYKFVQNILNKYQFDISAKQRGAELSEAKKRIVMIIRQLICQPKLLIIDGLMDFISFSDKNGMEILIRDIIANGTTVIYLTYNYNLAMHFSDRLLFLQNGLIIYELEKEEFSINIMKKITSNPIKDLEIKHFDDNNSIGSEILQVNGLCTENLQNISFNLRKGEIVGLIGKRNSGISEFLRCLSGHQQIKKGRILVDGRQIDIKNPKTAIKNGIRICMDNHSDMLLPLSNTIKMNISLSVIKKISRWGLINKKYEEIIAREYCKKFGINYTSHCMLKELNYATMSKIAITSCMVNNPKILILDKVTRGIDENGMKDLYNVLMEVRKTCGVILNFSKMEKELNICNRVVIMSNKGVVEELKEEEIEYQNILT